MNGIRIGELADRLGVTTDLLRAWERRHELFDPERTRGGYRLYSPADESRARRVLALRARGVPLADAAARVVGARPARPPSSDPLERADLPAFVDRIHAAVLSFDAVAVNTALDEAVDVHGRSIGLGGVAIGYLRRLGDEWEAGRVGVAHEHFASHLIRRRVGDHLLLHPADGRPTAVLACPPGERHDIGLLVVAVLLSHEGWCVRFLGADTPLPALAAACAALDPSLVILSAARPSALVSRARSIRWLAPRWPVAIGGRGADAGVAEHLGANLLPHDVAEAPAAAAAILAARTPTTVGVR
ncbi:MAG: MerR family transcriptional regulator [Nostocoides sp.]